MAMTEWRSRCCLVRLSAQARTTNARLNLLPSALLLLDTGLKVSRSEHRNCYHSISKLNLLQHLYQFNLKAVVQKLSGI